MLFDAFSAPSVGRLVPLSQEEVSRAVRRQQLSEVWTVDYAQDLLLIGGLLPETVWLAYHLGDWKTAASLSLAYTNYRTDHFDFTRLRRRELHLPTDLEPESIFQVELECLLGNKSDSQEFRGKDGDKSFAGLWDVTTIEWLQQTWKPLIQSMPCLHSFYQTLWKKKTGTCYRFPYRRYWRPQSWLEWMLCPHRCLPCWTKPKNCVLACLHWCPMDCICLPHLFIALSLPPTHRYIQQKISFYTVFTYKVDN